MGRRSLPSIDPGVDLDQHLIVLEDLPETPFDPQALFPRRQPLELEIGSGKGHFLLTHSGQHEARNFLGNEISRKYARFGAYRLSKHNRNNARMVSGDGLRLFRDLLPGACAAAVHVYFPDPWWKARHRRRRIMQPAFIADVERVLAADGVLHFWTDVQEYFDETIQLLGQVSSLSGPAPVPVNPPGHDMDYRTHFERRMRLGGHDVFRARYTKP